MKHASTPRPACSDDLAQVAAIEAYCNKPPWSQDAFAKEIGKKTANFWVLTDDETDEKIFAYIVFSLVGEQAHIQTLGVERKLRRQGNASRLVRFVINFVLRGGGESIYLEVRKSNSGAIALYQQLGFVVIRTVKNLYPDGEDAYAMLFKFKEERLGKNNEDDDGDAAEIDKEVDAESKKNIN